MTDPTWLARAHGEMGTAEIDGLSNNPAIMGYFRACGSSADWVKSEDTPWCGAFVGSVMAADGFVLPSEPLRARAWLGWGTAINTPRPGCVVVFTRGSDPASGHVALFRQMSEDGSKVYVLGGNQGDCVSIAAFPVDQVLGYRWPPNAPKTINGSDPVITEVSTMAKVAAAAGSVGTATVAIPAPPTETIAVLGAWKDSLTSVVDFVTFAAGNWIAIGTALVAWTGWRLWSLRKSEIDLGTVWKG